jgi:hypothetical protein
LPASHTIDFVLEDRPDKTYDLRCNYKVQNNKRLSKIVASVNGSQARRYALAYSNSPSTSRSLLTSVTEYGADDVTTLPAVTFTYQVKPFSFGPVQDWSGLNSQGQTGPAWNSADAATNSSGNTYTFLRLMDIDGDGLPDRIMRQVGSPYTSFIVQRNTGTNFEGNYTWGGLDNQGTNTWQNGSISTTKKVGTGGLTTSCDLIDINGDGRPDRVMTNNQSSTSWLIQTNSGLSATNSFSVSQTWSQIDSNQHDIYRQNEDSGGLISVWSELVDLNGDGLPDRLLVDTNTTEYYVQFNTGNGFASKLLFNNSAQGLYTYDLFTATGKESCLADVN